MLWHKAAGAGGLVSGAATDPNFSDVSLLLHGDGTDGSTTIVDSSSNGFTVTANGNAQIDTSVVKYGTGSIKFDGSGDYLTLPSSSEFAFGTGDFTVEFWVYRSTEPDTYNSLVSTGTATLVSTFQFGFGGPGETSKFNFFIGDGFNFVISSSAVGNGTWIHAAVTRSGSTIRLFVDGNLEASGTNSNDLSDSNLRVAINRNSNRYFNGYIDDLRITKGVARYTSSFTPPTAAFPDS